MKLISGNLFLKRGAGGGHRASKISFGTAQSAFGYVFHRQNPESGGVGDTTAPAAPIVTFPLDESFINDNTPNVTGTAEVGATVKIYLDTVLIGSDVADGGGNWSFVTPAITEGLHQFSITATDPALNVSSPTVVDFVVDVTPPTFAGVATVDASSSTTLDITYAQATDNLSDQSDIRYTVWLSTTPGIDPDVDASYTTNIPFGGLQLGDLLPGTTYYVVVRAYDQAGNVDTNTVELSDTTPAVDLPEATVQIWNPDWQAVFETGPARTQAEYQVNFPASWPNLKMVFDWHIDSSNIVSSLKIRVDGAQQAVFLGSEGDPGPEQVNQDNFDAEVNISSGIQRIQFEWNTLEGAITQGNIDYWIDPRLGQEYFEYIGISNVRFYSGATLVHVAEIDHVLNFLDSSGTPSGPLAQNNVWYTRTLQGTPSGDPPYDIWYSWPMVTPPALSLVWINVQAESIARDRGGVIALANGEVLVVGGYNDGDEYLSSANLYQASNGWNRISAGTVTGEGGDDPLLATFTAEPNDVLLAGGVGEEYFITDRVSIWSYSTKTWAAAASLPAPREHGALIALNDGRVLCIGGNSNSDTLFPKVATTYAYSRSGNSWSTLGALNTARDQFACVKLLDGRVMVLGGATGNVFPPTNLVSCEIFTPGPDTWATVAPLAAPATYFPAATVLPNGKVLAINGGGNYQVYDPDLDTWTAPAPMSLSGESWLFTDPSGVALLISGGSTWVYDPDLDSWSQDNANDVNFANSGNGRYVHTGIEYVLFGLPEGDTQVARTTGAG